MKNNVVIILVVTWMILGFYSEAFCARGGPPSGGYHGVGRYYYGEGPVSFLASGSLFTLILIDISHLVTRIPIHMGMRILPIHTTLTHMTNPLSMLNQSSLIPGITVRMHKPITPMSRVAREGGRR
jgi:hypothetical protein